MFKLHKQFYSYFEEFKIDNIKGLSIYYYDDELKKVIFTYKDVLIMNLRMSLFDHISGN